VHAPADAHGVYWPSHLADTVTPMLLAIPVYDRATPNSSSSFASVPSSASVALFYWTVHGTVRLAPFISTQTLRIIGVASYVALGHVVPPLDFQQFIFATSLFRQQSLVSNNVGFCVLQILRLIQVGGVVQW